MIKIHVLHAGDVRVSPYLPFGGDHCSLLKASGMGTPKKKWLWLPVFCFLVEHPKGRILVDTGWHREMSPEGTYDRKAQIRSLGSRLLYMTNQGRIERGAAVDEQLEGMGLSAHDLDYVLLTHLDCDHASGLRLVGDARRILVARTEMEYAMNGSLVCRVRYNKRWWDGVNLTLFDWNAGEGPVGRSYDLLGDGSVALINIPGHSAGLCAVRVRNGEGRFVLLFSDGGYAARSWKEMITSGIAMDKELQRRSLLWIREESMKEECVESLASHDADLKPHSITL